jgi:hypothetical protein
MSSDDGGPGTRSSSVRRSRYNRGAFAAGRAWAGACFRVLAATSLFFRVGAGAFFRLVMRAVLADVRAWLGAFFRLAMRAVLGGVRAWFGAGFRLLAAAFPFFWVAVLFVLVVLVVRDPALGRLAERRSAGDFLV